MTGNLNLNEFAKQKTSIDRGKKVTINKNKWITSHYIGYITNTWQKCSTGLRQMYVRMNIVKRLKECTKNRKKIKLQINHKSLTPLFNKKV